MFGRVGVGESGGEWVEKSQVKGWIGGWAGEVRFGEGVGLIGGERGVKVGG